MINERISHIEQWEESRENVYDGQVVDVVMSDEMTETQGTTECPHCGKICKSKAGLANHIERVYRKTKCVHKCVGCSQMFYLKTNWKTHEKKFRGMTSPTKFISNGEEVPDIPRAEISFELLQTPRELYRTT